MCSLPSRSFQVNQGRFSFWTGTSHTITGTHAIWVFRPFITVVSTSTSSTFGWIPVTPMT